MRAWALYDWANSAFVTTVITAVFPPYYQKVAAAGLAPATASARFSYVTSAALTAVALLAPVLGALADRFPIKKRLLGAFLAPGVAATAALALVGPGDWRLALGLFAVANFCIACSFVFYDSLLPHVARADELDRVSTAGYALGYLGGGILLAVNLAMVQAPHLFGLADAGAGARASFASVAVWWLLFSIPLFRRVREPAVTLAARRGDRTEPHSAQPVRTSAAGTIVAAFGDLRRTLGALRRLPHAFVFLASFLIYNDGIQTVIRMAALYGAEVGIQQGTLIAAILVVQFVGVPSAFLFGHIATRVGPKPMIFGGLITYAIVCGVAYRMSGPREFWILAVLVGVVQGGTQALSRSLFASLIPRQRSAEFFGLFAVFEKFAGIFGPLVFGLAITTFGSSRAAIVTIVIFFIIGGLLLRRVDVDAGRRAARQAEADEGEPAA